MARRLALEDKKLTLTDEIEGYIEKRVTPFGTGAKVDCPKEYIGKRAILVILRE